MVNTTEMDQFMAMSWLYLKMNEKGSEQMTIQEVEDLIIAINENYSMDSLCREW